MKHFLGLLFFSLFALSAQTLFAQHTAGAWKEMSDFHEVMSTTFHPAEEGNLQPLRMKAEELYTRAKSWKASAVPAGYDAAKTKDTLKRLVKQCMEDGEPEKFKLHTSMGKKDFGVGAQILRELGISKIRLLTNHPRPRTGFIGYGLEIVENVKLNSDG